MDNMIFGYTWEEIQAAQRGGRLVRAAPNGDNNSLSSTDMDLLSEHGEEGLVTLGFMGTLDRLKRANII